MSTKRRSRTGEDQVARVQGILRQRILNWQYAPGRRLIEEELSREFGVSRGPLREALRELEAGGFVAKARNKGYSVKQPDLRETEELYEVRKALELYVVEGLCRTGLNPSFVEELNRFWDEDLPESEDVTELLADRDQAFHEAIARAYGNTTLLTRLQEINERIYVFRRVDFGREEVISSACEQHRRIARALIAGDATAARELMRENIEHAQQNVESALKEMLLSSYSGAR